MNTYKTITNPTPLYALIGGKWEFKYNLNPDVELNAVEFNIILKGKEYPAIVFRTTKYPKAAVLFMDVIKVAEGRKALRYPSFGIDEPSKLERDVKVVLEQNPGGACRIIGSLCGFGEKIERPIDKNKIFMFSKGKEKTPSGLQSLPVNLPVNAIIQANISNITQEPPTPIRYTPPAEQIGGGIIEGGTTPEPPNGGITPTPPSFPPFPETGGGGAGTGSEEPAAATTPSKIPFYKNKYFIIGGSLAALVGVFFLGRFMKGKK